MILSPVLILLDLYCVTLSWLKLCLSLSMQMLLPAANLLQLTEVRDACCDFLQSQLHPSNCLGIRAFADLHACTELLSYSQTYTEQHFRCLLQFISLCNCHGACCVAVMCGCNGSHNPLYKIICSICSCFYNFT